MSLKDWARNGWLTEHKTSPQEIEDLLRVADRDLADCQAEGLSPDWHLNIAYNAALQLANAAVIEALAEHCGVPKRSVRILRGARGRRKWVEIFG